MRIRSAWGLARAGNRIRDAVQAAVKAAKRNGDIVGGPFYVLPEQAVIVRDRSDVDSNTLRRPENLPPEEVKVAISRVVEENYGAEPDQLVQAVARLFGFGSTSAQLREVVESALTDLLDSGPPPHRWPIGDANAIRSRYDSSTTPNRRRVRKTRTINTLPIETNGETSP